MKLMKGIIILADGFEDTEALTTIDTETDQIVFSNITVPSEKDLSDCYQLAEKTVKKYYYAEEKLEDVDFDNVFLYDSLNKIIEKKLDKSKMLLEIKSENISKESLIAEYFHATCTLQEYEIREDGLFIKLYVNAEIQYPDYADKSYFGNSVDILFVKANNKLKIADILFYGDVTSNNVTLSADKWDLSVNFKEINKEITLMENSINESKQMIEKINASFAKIEGKTRAEILKEKESIRQESLQKYATSTTTYTVANFDRKAMVNYAKRTAPLISGSDCKLYYNGSSARGSSQVPYYYDFSRITGAYDCTNFASHVLLAGGARVTSNWFFNNPGTTGPGNRSESWSSVNAFRNAFMNNKGAGPRADVNGNPEDATILMVDL